MKELQKYYAHRLKTDGPDCQLCAEVYLASEAAAAFAEMRREHTDDLAASARQLCAYAAEIERLKAEHETTIKRLQSAARSGMEAAHAISSHNLERARKLHNESKPDVIESERSANAILTEENDRLRKQAERYEKLRRLNVSQFKELFDRNINGAGPFDALVDQLSDSSGEQGKI